MGSPNWPSVLAYTALSAKLAFAGRTIVSAPLPAAQSGNVAASLLALSIASMSEHWPSAMMLGLFVVTVIVAAAPTPCPSASSKAAPARTKPSYAVVVVHAAESIRQDRGQSLERAIRRWRARRALRGKARRSA